VAATPPEFFRNLLEDIGQSWTEFQKLGEVLEERCNQEGGEPVVFPTSAVRKALDTCRETAEKIARPIIGGGEQDVVPLEEGGEAMASAGHALGAAAEGVSGRVGTREEAFRTLLRVAEFFKRTEPHSPVSYALEQAVRWGKMPLPQLLDELIPEDAVRQQLFKLIGIHARPPEAAP
jgi:type VI secretion system protein ImpA